MTESIWTYVLTEKHRFTNRFFNAEGTKAPIVQIPLISSHCHTEWREFFYKWSTKGYLAGNKSLRRSTFEQQTELGKHFDALKTEKERLPMLI